MTDTTTKPETSASKDKYDVYCLTKNWLKYQFDFVHRDAVGAIVGDGIVLAAETTPKLPVPDESLYRVLFHFRKYPPQVVRECVDSLDIFWLDFSRNSRMKFPSNPYLAVSNTDHVGCFFARYWIPLFLQYPGHEAYAARYSGIVNDTDSDLIV